ncbi:MAG: hypothetical protein CMJ80_18030 [Planctomycetaceae bacterium]|nr:hypothetical protein [Planctomycetaceae bacterium]
MFEFRVGGRRFRDKADDCVFGKHNFKAQTEKLHARSNRTVKARKSLMASNVTPGDSMLPEML